MASTDLPSTPAPAPAEPIAATMEVMEVDEASNALSKKSGPGGKHDVMRTYSPDEAALVFQLVEAHAPRWTHIAKLVSEATKQPRTAASVRNYYKRFVHSKKIADNESATRKLNRCQVCGQIKRGHICKGPPATEANDGAPPKGLTTATAATANAAAPAAASDAAARPPPPAAATPPPAASSSGLIFSSKDEKPLPPLAPAALEVLMPGANVNSPSALSTPGPLSLSGVLSLSGMLGSPTAFAALGLPTPASMPASATATAACFPFGRLAPSRTGAEDEIFSVNADIIDADIEGRENVDPASHDIGALPMAAAEVEAGAH